MVIYTYRIEYKYGDTIKIKPLFDVHYGHKACDVNAVKQYLAEDDDKNTYIIGGGDTIDSIIVTDPRYRKSMDATSSDDIIDEQIEGIEKILSPYKDRIIGLARGNHEKTIIQKCSTNPIKRLCKRLDTKDLGYSGLIRLILNENKSRIRTVIIKYHHGWGGGSRTQGADLTKYSKDLQYWDADIFLYGHIHRKQTDRVPRLGLSGEELISKPKIECICGTFQKTYTRGPDSTWAEERGYPPTEIGGLIVKIKPVERWVTIKVDV